MSLFPNLRHDTELLRQRRGIGLFRAAVEGLLFDNGYQAVVLHRIAHWFKRRRWPFFGPLFGRLNLLLTGVEIAPGAHVGPGLTISHGTGLVIGQWARLGSEVTLLHQVTIGATGGHSIERMPTVGDRVFIGAGAKVIGDLTVGDDVLIGVNAVITRDIPPGCKVLAKGGVHVIPPEQRTGGVPAAPPAS